MSYQPLEGDNKAIDNHNDVNEESGDTNSKTGSFDMNTYTTTKTATAGVMDVALLTSNANQIKLMATFQSWSAIHISFVYTKFCRRLVFVSINVEVDVKFIIMHFPCLYFFVDSNLIMICINWQLDKYLTPFFRDEFTINPLAGKFTTKAIAEVTKVKEDEINKLDRKRDKDLWLINGHFLIA